MTAALAPSLVLSPIRAAAPAQGTFEVLIRVQAPAQSTDASSKPRTPLRLAVVIDRSGSMSGQPLDEALRCAEYIAQRMLPSDQLGVVLYDDEVQVPVPLRPGGDAQALRAALAGVESGGSTALFDGWQAGAGLLEAGTDSTVSRVLLLSDGQANHGLCEVPLIAQHCSRWAAKGVTTSTVGLGRHFNEDLMIQMARAGGGRQYYGQTAEDLHDGFDEELSLLQALFMRQLRVKLVPATGVIAEPLGLLNPVGEGAYGLPDLAYSAEAWLLVRLHIDKPGTDPRLPQPLLAVTLEGALQDGGASATVNGMLSLPVVNASDCATLPADEVVLSRLKEVEFGEAAARIADRVAAGDLAAARDLLQRLRSRVGDHPWLVDKLSYLERLVESDTLMAAKELRYSQMRTSNRLANLDEIRYCASETESADIPAYLRRKGSEGQGRKRNG